ncbi:MAG TPA: M20/M25/M40 family metallo-hydrolase [Gemmatimonadaceae bacterium]|nr:M20/M25/M40 family metallo-hydrolase [Gemmatimonadaceae bacterium]
MTIRRKILGLALLGCPFVPLRAQQPTRQSELGLLTSFLTIPNVASDGPNIARNAQWLRENFEQRGFHMTTVATAGSPVLVGELTPPGPRPARTLTFYFHYDGQPVVASEWKDAGPFQPIYRDRPLDEGGRIVTLPPTGQPDPEWRLYARSASDDRGPIVAFLSALDEARASGQPITSVIRVLMEGDEEAGSPSLARVVHEQADRIRGDLILLVDGPRHPSGRPTFVFGARGIMSAELTVFGARQDLHSGNYGNWAPNPAEALSRLIASMTDTTGRVTIPGFYDDVVPLTSDERAAIAEVPDEDATLMHRFGFARPDNPGQRLDALDNLPTLNVSGLGAGTVAGQGRTVIPSQAVARLDLRFVKNVTPAAQFARLEAFVRSQGYHLIAGDAPSDAERAEYPRLAKLRAMGGYPAGRTPLTNPTARQVVAAVAAATGTTPARLPTLGGSTPFYLFSGDLGAATVGMPVVNFDNNQHGPNENLRLGNFFDAIVMMRAIVTMR